jgi:hypothetical protein
MGNPFLQNELTTRFWGSMRFRFTQQRCNDMKELRKSLGPKPLLLKQTHKPLIFISIFTNATELLG